MKGRPVGPSMQNQRLFSKLWWNSMGTFIKTRLQSMYQNIHPACHPCAWWWIVLDTTVSWRSWLDIIKIREPHGLFAKSISRQPMVLKNTYSGNFNSRLHGKKTCTHQILKKTINTPIYHNWLVETKPMGFFFGSKHRYRLRVNLAGIRHNLTGPWELAETMAAAYWNVPSAS